MSGVELSMDHLAVVQEALYDALIHWYNLGLKLGLEVNALDTIKEQCSGDPKRCFTEMLKQYLNTTTPPPSWIAVVDALKCKMVAEHKLAETLEKKFCCEQPTLQGSGVYLKEDELHIPMMPIRTSSAVSTDEEQQLECHSTYDLWKCSSDFQTEEKQWRKKRRERKLKIKSQRLETCREAKLRVLTMQIGSKNDSMKIKMRAKKRAELREKARNVVKVIKMKKTWAQMMKEMRRADRKKSFYRNTWKRRSKRSASLMKYPAKPIMRRSNDDNDRQENQILPERTLSLASYVMPAQLQKDFYPLKLEVIKEEKDVESPQEKKEACKVKGRRRVRSRQKRKARSKRNLVMEMQQKQQLYNEEKAICQELIGYLQQLSLAATSTKGPSFTSLDLPSVKASPSSDFSIEGSSRSMPTDKAGVFLPHKTRRRSQRDEKRMVLRHLIYNPVISSKFYFLDINPPTTLRKASAALLKLQDKLDQYDTSMPRPTSPTSTNNLHRLRNKT